jgi:hypothetical protein
MNQSLKPTVSWVSLFGGLLVVVANVCHPPHLSVAFTIVQLPHPNLFPGFLCFAVDSVGKTCHRRFNAPHPDIRKIFACGHNNVDKVCEMCYLGSDVLHPYPGEFAFGYHDP